MKKTIFVLMVVIVFSSCQSRTKVAPVNTEAEKAAITQVVNNGNTAMNSRNGDPYLTTLTDDALICGTDSREFWTKTEFSKMSTQMFADTTIKINFKPDKREIKISSNGNSAIVVEQMVMNFISPTVPIRRILHLVKNNNNWKIDFDCTNLIPNNEDLSKINKALNQNTSQKGMIKVTVFYPFSKGKKFDMDYYCNSHMNLVKKLMGDFLKASTVEKGLAGVAPDSPAPYFAIGSLYFDSMKSFQAAFSKAGNLMADIPNFTDTEPLIQISEVVM